MMVRRAVIRSIPLFASLRDREVARVLQTSRRVVYPRRNVVFQEGERGDFLFIILSGTVKIVLPSRDGRQIVLSTLGKGEFFGVLSLLDGRSRSATAITRDRSVLLQVDRETFSELLSRNAEFTRRILVQVTSWVREKNQLARELGFYGVHDRILANLVKMAQDDRAGRLVIHEPPSHQELADRISSSREAVSRAMKVLKNNGCIVVAKKSWRLNRSAVSQFVGSA